MVPIRRHKISRYHNPAEKITRANSDDCESIAKFLNTYYISEDISSPFQISSERLTAGLNEGWIILLMRDKVKHILGCIVSKHLGDARAHKGEITHRVQNCGYIDYFCVHPERRSQGIGRSLLHFLDSYCSNELRMIHLFESRNRIWKLPPIHQGHRVQRHIQQQEQNPLVIRISPLNEETKEWYMYEGQKTINHPTLAFYPRYSDLPKDTILYKYNTGSVCLFLAMRNTHFNELAEVMFYWYEADKPSEKKIAAAIEEIINSSGYSKVMMDDTIPHQDQRSWIDVGNYYIYVYNTDPFSYSMKPWFWL